MVLRTEGGCGVVVGVASAAWCGEVAVVASAAGDGGGGHESADAALALAGVASAAGDGGNESATDVAADADLAAITRCSSTYCGTRACWYGPQACEGPRGRTRTGPEERGRTVGTATGDCGGGPGGGVSGGSDRNGGTTGNQIHDGPAGLAGRAAAAAAAAVAAAFGCQKHHMIQHRLT